MNSQTLGVGAAVVVAREDLQQLLDALADQGYQVLGPRVRDGAIQYDELSSVADLPIGWTDRQDGGHYRLEKRSDEALFGYVVGPSSWKRFLHPPTVTLWRSRRTEEGFELVESPQEHPRYAFFGVRPCELHAIQIQDRVFLQGPYVDPIYRSRRAGLFLVAVNCGQAGGTCFCTSMGTGPRARKGFDLALTELLDGERHDFVVEVGSPAGAEVMAQVVHRPATPEDRARVEEIEAETSRQMGRQMETAGLKELLYANLEHPRWEEVAARCLTCANCTMVCPTCFCTTVEDVTDLTGQEAERRRIWDSCFTMEFSYMHGGSVRSSARSRYRQWMTHKLATWQDQFDVIGCVGCGRCITWCPVGIDITQEVAAIRGQIPA